MRVAAFIFASLLLMALASAQTTKPDDKPGDKKAAEGAAEKNAVANPNAGAEKGGDNSNAKTAKKTQPPPKIVENKSGVLPSEPKKLVVEDVMIGKGKVATKGKTVKVHYTGWLYDATQPNGRGKQFDSSLKRGEPFSFPLGAGTVIRGWDEGFRDMRVGGKRVLIIPPELGYGAAGARTEIPGNSSLIFEVELMDVLDSATM